MNPNVFFYKIGSWSGSSTWVINIIFIIETYGVKLCSIQFPPSFIVQSLIVFTKFIVSSLSQWANLIAPDPSYITF